MPMSISVTQTDFFLLQLPNSSTSSSFDSQVIWVHKKRGQKKNPFYVMQSCCVKLSPDTVLPLESLVS